MQYLRDGRNSREIVSLLIASPSDEDHTAFHTILEPLGWKVASAQSCGEAHRLLERHLHPVVVCERSLPDGNWQTVLGVAQSLRHHPALIVASRQADEHLWAEVLNLGGFDVILKPYDTTEVVRILESAWRQWKRKPTGSQQRVRTLGIAGAC